MWGQRIERGRNDSRNIRFLVKMDALAGYDSEDSDESSPSSASSNPTQLNPTHAPGEVSMR
jgi:hypothetical protein